MTKKWLIYGANGYSGELIAKKAKEQNLNPVIAGRKAETINLLAKDLNFEARIFDLTDSSRIEKNLEDIDVVIHCAGPFSMTAKPMIEACISSKTHYLDITGEISVFELAKSYDNKAKEAGVVLCPGVGFDVIPTDCLASQLKELMPDATHLSLGFDSKSRTLRSDRFPPAVARELLTFDLKSFLSVIAAPEIIFLPKDWSCLCVLE